MSTHLAVARADLGLARRVGLVLRRFRRERGLSQRALAHRVGWSSSAVGRAEVDASSFTAARLEEVLRHTGHRLAIVADTGRAPDLVEDPAHAWGVPDLVARDARGRRLPATGRVRYRPQTERWVDARCVGHEEPWVWTRPR